jgi:K+-transporting ATPase KdpF subunit
MKLNKVSLLQFFGELVGIVRERWNKSPVAKLIILGMSLNLLIAPAVMAASGTEITRQTAYAIGILYCVTLGLSVYLFTVIFQPERF